jgi:branched-chain amino acid transport system ATP-binding protein
MLLKVDNIRVHFSRLEAVRGVSLEVAEGEVVCIVGPNGAGKSTTLLSIAGVLSPTFGSISYDGQSLTNLAPEAIARRGISLVPEGRHVFGRLTVEENLRMGTGMRRDRAAVRDDIQQVLAQFPILKDRWRGLAGKLSGGEQQQLVIARALMTRPRLVLIDEPALGLAPRIIEQVYQLLAELRTQRGLTLLVVEQSTERALRFADRIYVLRSGRIELTGTSAELAKNSQLEQAYFGFRTGSERAANPGL